MLFDDAEADRQAEPRAFAFRLGVEEWLEHVLGNGFGNPGPVVRNVHRQSVRLTFGDDVDAPAAVLEARGGDGLRRIVDDVDEDLLDLVRVDCDFRQSRLEREGQLDPRREELVLQKLMRRFENGADGLQLPLSLLAARERQQVPHDGGGALGFLADHGQRLGQARRHVGRLGEQIAKAHDRGEGVVEVVRDARNQLPNRRHLFGLQQLLLQAAFLALVLEQEDPCARLSRRNRGHEQDAVARAHFDGSVAAIRRQQPRDGLAPRRWHQRQPRPAVQGRDGQLDELGEHPIGTPDRALGIDVANGLVERIDGLLPFPLPAREQLDEPCVLERDARLRQDGACEHQRPFVHRVLVVAFHRDGADGTRDRDDGHAEPARRYGLLDRHVQLGGAGRDAVGEHEWAAAQRKLQQRFVGGGRAWAVMVRHDQAVRIDVQQHDRQPGRRQLLGQSARDNLDDRCRAKCARQLLGQSGQPPQNVGNRPLQFGSSRNRVGTRVAASTSASADLMKRTTIGSDPCNATLRCMIPAMGPSSFLMICFQ